METNELLRKHLQTLREKESKILKSTEALRAKREAMNAKICDMQAERDELTAEINKAQQPGLAELKAEISRVAQALGGPRLSDGAGR